MALTKDSREFIECLRSNKVEFVFEGRLFESGGPKFCDRPTNFL